MLLQAKVVSEPFAVRSSACRWGRAASFLASPQARGSVLYVSSCVELCCPGVNTCFGTSENGREKTRLTKCTWCACRWYITGCAAKGSTRKMLSCESGYVGPMFSVLHPKQDSSTTHGAKVTHLFNILFYLGNLSSSTSQLSLLILTSRDSLVCHLMNIWSFVQKYSCVSGLGLFSQLQLVMELQQGRRILGFIVSSLVCSLQVEFAWWWSQIISILLCLVVRSVMTSDKTGSQKKASSQVFAYHGSRWSCEFNNKGDFQGTRVFDS